MAHAIPRQARPPLTAVLVVALGWPTPAIAGAMGSAPVKPGSSETDQEEPASPAEPPTTATGPATPPTETLPPTALPRSPVDGDPVMLSPEEFAQRQLQSQIEQATEHFKEGRRLYSNGRYAEAAVEFERSYAAVAAANTLYAVSKAYARAGKAVEAVRALQRYLKLPDCSQWVAAEAPIHCTAQRSDAEQDLADQRRRVGELTLDIPEGVELREVRVAGRTVPLDDFPLLMLPGTVDVELFGMGAKDRRTRPAYVTAGEVYEVYVAPWKADEITVRPPEGTGPEDEDPRRSERRQRGLEITFWTGVGLTAASGVVLGVMGGLTRYHHQRYGTEKCPVNCHELDEDGEFVRDQNGSPIPLDTGFPFDHETLFDRYKPITNAMVGVTIGLAVGTALVGAFALRKRIAERSERAEVRIRLGAPGLVVRW